MAEAIALTSATDRLHIVVVCSGQLAWIGGGNYLTATTHIAKLCAGVEGALLRGGSGQANFIADKAVPGWILRVMASPGDRLTSLSRSKIRLPVTRQDLAMMAVEVTLDTGKARRELGYVPAIGLDEGMRQMAAQFHSKSGVD